MSEKQENIRPIVGAFIFNEKEELFLMKSPKRHDKYVCPGGGVDLGESLEDAVIREIKEETNIDIKDIEFLGVDEDVNLGNDVYTKKESHLIFFDYRAVVKKNNKIILNEEAADYKWLKPEEWIKRGNLGRPTEKSIKKYLIEKKEGFEGQYKRALADYQNLLKQSAKEREEFVKYANEQLILEIIPVYNNLKISLEHVDKTVEKNGWLEGVKFVTKQFKDILNNLGVKEIETKGKKFDPSIMEALEGKGKKVKKEVMPGYILKEKVIMPAKVILE